MRRAPRLRRLIAFEFLMVLSLAIVAVLISVAGGAGGEALALGLGVAFFLGGIGWFIVGFLLGGSVETYLAPTFGSYLGPTSVRPYNQGIVSTPEGVKDAGGKLASQGPSVLAAITGAGLLLLSALFLFVGLAVGLLALTALLGVLLIYLIASARSPVSA